MLSGIVERGGGGLSLVFTVNVAISLVKHFGVSISVFVSCSISVCFDLVIFHHGVRAVRSIVHDLVEIAVQDCYSLEILEGEQVRACIE